MTKKSRRARNFLSEPGAPEPEKRMKSKKTPPTAKVKSDTHGKAGRFPFINYQRPLTYI
jgi:hypothetical protein